MKIFVDANILISVLNKKYPLFTHSARILSLSGIGNYKIYTSPVCLAIAFFLQKKNTKQNWRKKKLLYFIAPATETVVTKTISNKKINDFEDGLEYYSAVESKCDFIVTEDKNDFYFSDITVMNAKAFFEKIVAKK